MGAAYKDLKFILAAMVLLFFIGVKDDIIGFSPVKKLVGHMVVGYILVVMAGIRIQRHARHLRDVRAARVVQHRVLLLRVRGAGERLQPDRRGGWPGGWHRADRLADLRHLALLGRRCGALTAGLRARRCARRFPGLQLAPCPHLHGRQRLAHHRGHTRRAGHEGGGPRYHSPAPTCAPCPRPSSPWPCWPIRLVDTLRIFIYRMAARGVSPSLRTSNHIHHRLMDLKLGHRGTTMLLYLYADRDHRPQPHHAATWHPNIGLMVLGTSAFVLAMLPFVWPKRRRHEAHRTAPVAGPPLATLWRRQTGWSP